MTLPLFSPIIPFPLLLWLLSVCSLFQCLWLYFACLFVLLIRFHLQVRSYSVCLSLPGLFHLAQCSPLPFILLQRIGAPFFLLHSIPLCKCTSFLIHVFTDGLLGCFQHLAIVNYLIHTLPLTVVWPRVVTNFLNYQMKWVDYIRGQQTYL